MANVTTLKRCPGRLDHAGLEPAVFALCLVLRYRRRPADFWCSIVQFHRLALHVCLVVSACVLINSTFVRTAAAQRINLTGEWLSAYTCPTTGVQHPLRVQVVQHGKQIVGIKRARDRCITQDNVAVFLGEVRGFSNQMECATYGGSPPSLSYVTDAIQIHNVNNFTACQANFKRVGRALPQQPNQQQPPAPAPIRGPGQLQLESMVFESLQAVF